MVLLDEARVRELRLRVLVQRLHVRVRRRRVEVDEALLHVLTVIAFGAGEAEPPLLQDRIAPVPQRDGEADAPLAIGDAKQAVFAPAIGAAAGLVVWEVVPARSPLRIVLAHRPPLACGEIGAE